MHWVLQSNMYGEEGWESLLSTLQRMNIPHSIHKVVPFVGEIVPDIDPEGPVICMGSYSLRHLAKKKGWTPGVFDLEPFDFTEQLKHWGNYMLNADSVVSRFEDANFPNWDEKLYAKEMFIRPIHDSKSFAGKVFTKEEFYEWKRKIVVLEEDYGSSLDKNTLIQMCWPKKIYAEYRYWIVDGQIVTRSMYKRGDKVLYSDEVDEQYDRFVMRRIAEWQPLRAFVIDVCSIEGYNVIDQSTPEDTITFKPRIVEINTLNSSGFYAGDMQKLVFALEQGFGV